MPKADLVFADDQGEVEQFYFAPDGTMHRRHVSLNEDRIMAENAAMRAIGGVKSLSFGKMILRMSYAQYVFLRKVNPALASRDNQERTRAWQALARDGGYRNLQVEDH